MNGLRGRARAIHSFFDDVGRAGLLLPGGWFGGRPMEGHHRLTHVADLSHHLVVELDAQVMLVFSGEAEVALGTSELAMLGGTPTMTISGFSQLVFDWLGYLDLQPHVEVFHEGSVQFVAPL